MNKTLSETEYQIMSHFWETEGEQSFSQLMTYFEGEEGRTWKKQTLNTFLTRLIQKKLLKFRKIGNRKYYSVNMNKRDYEKLCAEEVLNGSYEGKLSKFLTALTGEAQVSHMGEQELIEYIKSK